MTRIFRYAFLLIVLALAAEAASAQVATGTPPFGSFGGGPDVINLGNLNSHLTIPVLNKAGRGMAFTYDLVYDSSIWVPVTSSGSTIWQPSTATNWGWTTSIPRGGHVSYNTSYHHGMCQTYYIEISWYYTWVYYDGFGTPHQFPGQSYTETGCTNQSGSLTATASDGSGYTISVTGSTVNWLTASDGAFIAPTTGAIGLQDRNGNEITSATSSGTTTYTDTLGTTALTVAAPAPPSSTTFTYTRPSFGAATYTMKYGTYTVQTNFGCGNIVEFPATSENLVSEIDLPDGSTYTFTYETTPNDTHSPHYVTGRLASVTFPTGGTITYRYTGGALNGSLRTGITCSDGSTAGLQRFTPDGNYWEYDRTAGSGAAYTTTVTDPSSNQMVLQFQGIYETNRQGYQGFSSSGTLLQTVDTCYNGSASPCTGTAITLPISQRNAITTVPAGSANLKSEVASSYNSYGQVTEEDDYGYGSGAVGPLLRKKLFTIITVGNVHPVQQSTVKDGSGSVTAQTTFTFDQGSVTSTSGTPQHINPTVARANPTTISYLVQGSTSLTKTLTYYDTGTVDTATDLNSNFTTSNYQDPTSTCGNAFPTSVSEPASLSRSMTWNCAGGLEASVTDENGNTTSFSYNDSLNRPTGISLPNNGWTLVQYDLSGSSPPIQDGVDLYTGTTNSSASTGCSTCRHDQTTLDGLGRVASNRLVNDPDVETYIDATHDSNGRIASVSNPYRGSSNGGDTYAYDALYRTTQVTHADGNVAHTYYGAAVGSGGGATLQNCSTSTYGYGYPILGVNETGNKRQTWKDALGRVIETDEPNSSSTLAVGTCYRFDVNDNLIQVTSLAMTPNQTRSYSYDLLSRVTSTTTPESGATNFYYTTSGGAHCSGDPSAVCRRTDARSITTTYTYDAMNRLTSKSYNDSNPTTPTVKYGYDAVALTGCTTAPPSLTITNGKGHRTAMCDGSGATSWSFDSVWNVLTEKRTIKGQTNTINYAYNLDSSISSIQYLGGRTVTYTEGNAQRMTAAADASNSINYTRAPSSGAMYSPAGALASDIHGYVSGGFAGITESYSFNNRLQVTAIQATSSAGTPLHLSYSYVSGDNGDISAQTNNVSAGRTQTYTYDNLNRLLTAQAQATSGGDCWGQSFGNGTNAGDDPLNNLLNISVAKCSAPSLSVSVNNGSNPTKNQITSPAGFSYDLAGNNTADGAYTYTYDAENRIITASGMTGGPYCYTYDGDGLRVMKAHASGGSCTGTVTVDMLYWRNIAGNTIAETDGSGSTTNSSYNEYVFFGGRRIAQSNPSSGNVYYYFVDHLGSTRLVTTATGTACYEVDYFPYGQENTPAGFSNTCSTRYRFTGYERDQETNPGNGSGNDYAFARYYNSRLGRFMSGDPLGGDISDPQTLNMYAYVRNNPINLTDPSGQFTWGGSSPPPDPGYNGSDSSGSMGIDSTPFVPWARFFPPLPPPPPPPPKPQANPCDSIKGKGGTLSQGSDNYTFDANGSLVGYSTVLNPNYALGGTGYTVPANTRVGIALTGSNSVTMTASTPAGAMPVRLGGFIGSFVTSATFTGNSYTNVNGTVAIAGSALGNASTASDSVLGSFNGNAQLLDFGSIALNMMKIANALLNCQNLLGAGS